MFGLIGHSTSFEAARRKALELGFDHIAEGDLDVWCSAPPQLVEHVEVTSLTGKTIQGAYIDSCFVPEMLSRFKTARRKVLNAMELAQVQGSEHPVSRPRCFPSTHFCASNHHKSLNRFICKRF